MISDSSFKLGHYFLCALLGTGAFVTSNFSAQARNGFIPHYVGAEGMIGGAGTASPLDATSTIANPAVLSRLNSHLLFNLGVIYQDQYVNSQPTLIGNPIGRQRNQTKYIFPLTLGINVRLNEQWAFGFTATGGGGYVRFNQPVMNPAGLNPPNGNFNKQTVNNVTLTATTVSYRPTPNQSYGISLLVATSLFKSDMAMPDGTQVEGALSPDMVFGTGVRIGGIWDLNKWVTLGASAATPVYSQRHHKYKQLFGKHQFEIPATARLGVTVHVTPKTDISFDIKELFYGESKWVNEGQGWKNQLIFLTGIMHHVTDKLSVGVGYNYAKAPIKEDKVLQNTLSIPLDEHHISGGVRYTVNKKVEVFLMGYYIPRKKMTDNGKGILGPLSQGLQLENASAGAEIGLKYNF